jgi:hypothetical protein
MRIINSVLVLASLTLRCFSQSAAVNVTANTGPRDLRPFGKYLVEICSISGEDRTLRCTPTPLPARPSAPNPGPLGATPHLADQTITIKLACNPATKTKCNPQYPLVAGSDFFVSATSDSGLTVQQTVLSGGATPVGGPGTIQYRANAPGLIVIRASSSGNTHFLNTAPVDLLLQVVADAKSADPPCLVLPRVLGTTATLLDAATIASLMGNPTPFLLAAQGPNTIAIYSTRQPLRPEEERILESFQNEIVALAGRTFTSLTIPTPNTKPFTVELKIAHAAALGDLATRLGGLNYSQFTIVDVGSDRIRVTATTTPDCDTWKGFLSNIRHIEWQLISEPMSKKLYYLSSSDVAAAFGGSTGTTAAATPAATTPATSTPATTPAPAATVPVPAVPSPASITISQPPGSNIQIDSDTTPCVLAGLAFGNTNACGSAGSSPAAGSATPAAATPVTPAPQAPLGIASMGVNAGNGEQNPPDLLVYSDTNPGDDAQIAERNRVIALLDLPRPEMIISAWVTQNSTASPEAAGAFSNMVKGLVADYDQEFQSIVLTGWRSVKTQSATPGYFNESFRSYIEDRFVADTYQPNKPDASLQELSQSFLDHSQAKLAEPVEPGRRSQFGLCKRTQYCLGYNDLFHPVKPALTDLLLTIIAAQDPVSVADNAILDVEGPSPPYAEEASCGMETSETSKRCHAIWRNLDLDHVSPPPGARSCADRDFRGIFGSLFDPMKGRARIHLQCFKDAAERLLVPAPAGPAAPPYLVGVIRAALADFLFNYKMSQQYPHEFSSYDLSHSADALNNALSPIIDAFNRDLWAYQLFVRADMQYRVERLNARADVRCCVKRLFGIDKPSFFNDGLVTVRTISGQWTYVNTTSQSFLNASTAPQLTTLLSSLTASNPAAPGANALASSVLSAGPLGKAAALSNALANYQTTFAQIGRSLAISAIPRSLNTASSAEIAVTLNADESAGGPTYTGGGATDPASNTSRVANHDTATRVRIDSVKLFEISSLSAIVERSRSRFPLLPPFVEIPYIGTFIGIPLGAAREFHASTAILSAYVVPTAADIAYGLRFAPDLVVDGLNPGACSFFTGAAGPDVSDACLFRRALSLRDFANQPVPNFNKEMVRCLATDTSTGGCQSVSLDRVPRMY